MQHQSLILPLAIFSGLGLIAGAIFLSHTSIATTVSDVTGVGLNREGSALDFNEAPAADSTPKRTGEERFVYGDPDAPVTIVEFSDFECPFCARVHPTLEQIVDESDGAVNWEYRHFPLPNHRNAELAARVGECVGRELGNDAFWQYGTEVFANYSSLSESYLTTLAESLGLSSSDLAACTASPDIAAQIDQDLATARSFGGNGTPFSVVVFADGSTRPVSGALPYAQWKSVLNQ